MRKRSRALLILQLLLGFRRSGTVLDFVHDLVVALDEVRAVGVIEDLQDLLAGEPLRICGGVKNALEQVENRMDEECRPSSSLSRSVRMGLEESAVA